MSVLSCQQTAQWGVRRIFGYPATGHQLACCARRPAARRHHRFVQVRHEEMAAFMAVAQRKFTGEIASASSTAARVPTHMITWPYAESWTSTARASRFAVRPKRHGARQHYHKNSISTAMFADVAVLVPERSAPSSGEHRDRPAAIRIAKAGNAVRVLNLPSTFMIRSTRT